MKDAVAGGTVESNTASAASTSGNSCKRGSQPERAGEGAGEELDLGTAPGTGVAPGRRRPQRVPDISARRAGIKTLGEWRKTLRLAKSIIKLCLMKKSEPSMGLATSAKQKLCVTLKPLKHKSKGRMPNVGMIVPLAALSEPEDDVVARSACEAGKTEMSAPESMRNGRLSL